jgi:hypothetical protein
MPLSGLDPGMLLGFVARDEAEWMYLKGRVKEVCGLLPLLFGACTESHSQLPRTILAMADEPSAWPGADEDGVGLESISDPKEAEEERGMTATCRTPRVCRPRTPRTAPQPRRTSRPRRSRARTNITILVPPPGPLRRAAAACAAKKSTPRRILERSGAGTPSSPRERKRMVTVSSRAAGVNAGANTSGQRMHTARADIERGRAGHPYRGLMRACLLFRYFLSRPWFSVIRFFFLSPNSCISLFPLLYSISITSIF